MGSVMTFLLWVMNSTISLSAARFTSFHFRSLKGSEMKSKSTQHWRSFCTNNFSCSAGGTSTATGRRADALALTSAHGREKLTFDACIRSKLSSFDEVSVRITAVVSPDEHSFTWFSINHVSVSNLIFWGAFVLGLQHFVDVIDYKNTSMCRTFSHAYCSYPT